MAQETDKNYYSTSDMLDAARRLRSPGVSQRSGRKLKRRSVQPGRERAQFIRVLVILGFFVAVVFVGFASWWLTRRQEDSRSKGPSGVIPTNILNK